mgnify:CR=1 FL=1
MITPADIENKDFSSISRYYSSCSLYIYKRKERRSFIISNDEHRGIGDRRRYFPRYVCRIWFSGLSQ